MHVRHSRALAGTAFAICSAFTTVPALAANLLGYTTGPQDGSPRAGALTDPACCTQGDFGLHDHGYVAPNVPDPTRGLVIFTYDAPVVVDAIDMVQHTNGITYVEQFVGNSLSSMVSVGASWSADVGDTTGGFVFGEMQHDSFSFNDNVSGTIHEFVIRKTSLVDGYASYRWYLDAAVAVPEPSSAALALAGLVALGMVARRRAR